MPGNDRTNELIDVDIVDIRINYSVTSGLNGRENHRYRQEISGDIIRTNEGSRIGGATL